MRMHQFINYPTLLPIKVSYTSYHNTPNLIRILQILSGYTTDRYCSFLDSVSSQYSYRTYGKRPFFHSYSNLSFQCMNCSCYTPCGQRKSISIFIVILLGCDFSSVINAVAHIFYESPQFSYSVTNSSNQNTRFVIVYLDGLRLSSMDEVSRL